MARFKLGPWLVLPDELAIRKNEQEQKLEPRAMALLVLLLERCPELISIADIIDTAWQGAEVSDSVVYRAINLLRKALEQGQDDTKYIESVPRKGYRLNPKLAVKPISDTEIETLDPETLGEMVLAVVCEPSANDRLSSKIAAKTVRNLSWAADAFAVQRNPEPSVACDYRIQLDPFLTDHELCVNWELWEATRETLLWTGEERRPDDSEASIDHLCEVLVDGINEQLRREISKQVNSRSNLTDEMSYWQLILSSDQFDGMEPNNIDQRRARLSLAMSRYPLLAPAHAAYADLISWEVINGLGKDLKQVAIEARQAASTAVDLDRNSPYVLSRCGAVFSRLGEYERGVELCQRAQDFAPSSSTREALARALCFAGQPGAAIELMLAMLESLPKGQVFRFGKLVIALVQAGRMNEALQYSNSSVNNYPKDYYNWALHANLLAHLQRHQDAIAAWQEVERLMPGVSIERVIGGTSRTYGRTSQQIEYLTGGLRQIQIALQDELEGS